MNTDEHVGFLKEAGLKQLAGRVIKSVGSALGSGKMQRKGMTMQHGTENFVKTKVKPKPSAAAPKGPRMQLVVPHNTPKAQRDLMAGNSKAKPMYVQPYGGRRKP